MGWSFRRSKSFGPFRLTLGKRGIGGSIGAGGARISHSSRGTSGSYSIGGFTFRKSLGRKKAAGASKPLPGPPITDYPIETHGGSPDAGAIAQEWLQQKQAEHDARKFQRDRIREARLLAPPIEFDPVRHYVWNGFICQRVKKDLVFCGILVGLVAIAGLAVIGYALT